MEINILTKPNQQTTKKAQGPYDAELQQTSQEFLKALKALENHPNWKLTDEKPMAIYEMKVDSRVIAKGVYVINLPFQTVLNFLADPSYVKKVSGICKLFQIMHQTSSEKVVHMIMSFPGPISDRQMVTTYTTHLEGNKAYIGNRSCKYPFKKHPDTVISDVHVSGIILQRMDGGKTKAVSISDIDPQGMIPGFINNSVASKRVQFLLTLQDRIKGK